MDLLKLPSVVISPVDIARLQREIGGLNDFFIAARARKTGTAMQLPKLSRMLDQLAHLNKVNLLEASNRANLLAQLENVQKHAPHMHISFASEPSQRALEQILVWLRDNIHPQTLLQVGLQPSIAAGCVLRTANKVFDMSLRASLQKQIPYLTQLIAGAADGR